MQKKRENKVVEYIIEWKPVHLKIDFYEHTSMGHKINDFVDKSFFMNK